MKMIRALLFWAGLAAIALGLWNLSHIWMEYHQGDTVYSEIANYVTAVEPESVPPAASPESPADRSDSVTSPASNVVFPTVDFDSLRKINPSVVGWISGEDTPINYPIVQATDNDYYLEHLFSGEPNGSGAIFLDCANHCDFSDQNSIIYGHNMKNGSMFASLAAYKDPNYYTEHPSFLLMTPEKNYTITFFAGFSLSGWGDAWQTSFPSDADFEVWLQTCTDRSLFHTDVIPTCHDRVVTLSTCSYEFDDARFVLMGVLREA